MANTAQWVTCSANDAWLELMRFLAMHPATYRTRLKNGGSGARFRAELTVEGHVRVTLQKGQQHVLPERDFADLYALYFRREQGEAVTARAKAVSHYSMYFWGVSKRSLPGGKKGTVSRKCTARGKKEWITPHMQKGGRKFPAAFI